MKLLKNTHWLFVEKLVSLSFGLFLGIFLARELGPEVFGAYSVLLALIFVLQPLLKFGLHSIITRELCAAKISEFSVLKASFLLRFFASIFVVIVVISYLFFATSYSFEMRILFICLLLAYALNPLDVFSYWFDAHVNARPIVIFRSIHLSCFTILKVISVLLAPDITPLVMILAVEVITGYLGIAWVYQIYAKNLKSIFQTKLPQGYIVSLAKQSAWLVLSGLAAALYMKIDQVMLSMLVNDTEVGFYAVAVKFSEMAYFVPVAIVTSLFPLLIKSKRTDQNADSFFSYPQLLSLILGGLFWLAVVGIILCMWLASPVILTLFGEQYSPSIDILIIHIWASIFIFMRALISKWLLAESLFKYSLYTQGAGAIVNIIANYILIPTYGSVGAAIATLIAVAFSSWIALFLSNSTRQMAINMTFAPFYSILLTVRWCSYRQSLAK